MKIRIEGWIGSYHWGNPEHPLALFHFSPVKNTDPDYIDVCQHTIEVEIPAPTREELTVKTIELLQAEKQAAYVKAGETAARCEDKIQRLLALTNEAKPFRGSRADLVMMDEETYDDHPF